MIAMITTTMMAATTTAQEGESPVPWWVAMSTFSAAPVSIVVFSVVRARAAE
jgi:hypothetical protein